MSDNQKSYCFIQFKCTYPTNANEELYIVGNIKELGNWDVKKAEKLTSNKGFSYKTSKNIKVKQDVEIQYKYIIYTNGVFSHWEQGCKELECTNRVINPKKFYMTLVNDKKGKLNDNYSYYFTLGCLKSDVQHFRSGDSAQTPSDKEDDNSSSSYEDKKETQKKIMNIVTNTFNKLNFFLKGQTPKFKFSNKCRTKKLFGTLQKLFSIY